MKRLVLAALAALVFVSCSKEDIDEGIVYVDSYQYMIQADSDIEFTWVTSDGVKEYGRLTEDTHTTVCSREFPEITNGIGRVIDEDFKCGTREL